MGSSMAGHLLRAGYPVQVYNRTKEKAMPLVDQGATWQARIGDLAAQSDIVITIVGFPQDVEAIYFGNDGVLANARSGATLIDMTTSRPDLATEIARQASEKGIEALDAPVSGGDVGAREARLSIMVGATESAFNRVRPIFDLMGTNVVRQGPPGAGQHTKVCNQIAIAAGMLSVCESMIYARESGLDPYSVLKSIESGAAGSWSLSNLAPRMLKGDFAPGFYVKHFIKDMGIAIDSARRMGLELPGLNLAEKLYQRLAAAGKENNGTQGLFWLYEQGLQKSETSTQTH